MARFWGRKTTKIHLLHVGQALRLDLRTCHFRIFKITWRIEIGNYSYRYSLNGALFLLRYSIWWWGFVFFAESDKIKSHDEITFHQFRNDITPKIRASEKHEKYFKLWHSGGSHNYLTHFHRLFIFIFFVFNYPSTWFRLVFVLCFFYFYFIYLFEFFSFSLSGQKLVFRTRMNPPIQYPIQSKTRKQKPNHIYIYLIYIYIDGQTSGVWNLDWKPRGFN